MANTLQGKNMPLTGMNALGGASPILWIAKEIRIASATATPRNMHLTTNVNHHAPLQ